MVREIMLYKGIRNCFCENGKNMKKETKKKKKEEENIRQNQINCVSISCNSS